MSHSKLLLPDQEPKKHGSDTSMFIPEGVDMNLLKEK